MGLNLRPLGDRLVIEPNDEEAQTSPGGIIIPDTAKEKPQKGHSSSRRTGSHDR